MLYNFCLIDMQIYLPVHAKSKTNVGADGRRMKEGTIRSSLVVDGDDSVCWDTCWKNKMKAQTFFQFQYQQINLFHLNLPSILTGRSTYQWRRWALHSWLENAKLIVVMRAVAENKLWFISYCSLKKENYILPILPPWWLIVVCIKYCCCPMAKLSCLPPTIYCRLYIGSGGGWWWWDGGGSCRLVSLRAEGLNPANGGWLLSVIVVLRVVTDQSSHQWDGDEVFIDQVKIWNGREGKT